MSIQVWGRRARLAKARSASASGENCDPISRMAPGRASASKHLPAGHEGPKDGVGQIGLGVDELPELLWRHAQHPARSAHPGAQVWPLARQQIQLPDEPTGTVGGDHHLVVALANDLDLTVEHHEEVGRVAAGSVEHLTRLDRDRRTEGRDLAHRRRIQKRPGHVGRPDSRRSRPCQSASLAHRSPLNHAPLHGVWAGGY